MGSHRPPLRTKSAVITKPLVKPPSFFPGGWGQRFPLSLVIVLTTLALALSLLQPRLAEGVRTRVTDGFAPLLRTLAAPVSSVVHFVSALGNLTELRAENERLLGENERLRQYQAAVMRLEAENKGLRDLLRMQVDPAQRLITARVIADVGGPFMRNVVIFAGEGRGVREGLAVLAGGGLAGRVVSAGLNSSRVLLLNDINSRVPVLLEASRQRALVEGDNAPQLRLGSLPPDVVPTVGERLITSGVGGIFPPGLPVGVVSGVGTDGIIRVEPLADLGRLEMVQVLDPGTPPDLLSPESSHALPSVLRP